MSGAGPVGSTDNAPAISKPFTQPVRPRLPHLLGIVALIALTGCAMTESHITPDRVAAYRPGDFHSPVASAAGAAAERAKAMARIVAAEQPEASEATVRAALWDVAFYDTEHERGRRILQRELADPARPLATRSVEHQRALIAAAHMLDPAGAAPHLARQLESLATPREFAAAAHTLLKADAGAAQALGVPLVQRALAARLEASPAAATEPRLENLARALNAARGAPHPPAPPIEDLFSARWMPGHPVVYSLQRRDRRHLGLALVRGADGRFVRDERGGVLALPHLALALTGLPGTITNGNTPQGLFTIVGMGVAGSVWIGPTPYLYSKVPFEATVAEYEHRARGAAGDAPAAAERWTRERYVAMLPPSWRDHWPMHEAWLAGLAGRNEMLLHGTTIDAGAYRQRPWYPGTPSAGCLVALERWASDGTLVASDQLTLLKAFSRGGHDRGYLVVVELDDSRTPVRLAEVAAAIGRAEAQR